MICVVTNRKICGEERFLSTLEEIASYKPAFIILREKDLQEDSLLKLSIKVKKITAKYNIPLVLNGNLNVAKNIDAFAYHCSIKNFREFEKKPYKVVGVSVHSVEEAVEAERLNADYVLAGHIFETKCKEGLKGRGLEFLRAMKEKVSIPIVAIGGIKEENFKSVLKSGANKVAIMSSAMKEPKVILRLKKNI